MKMGTMSRSWVLLVALLAAVAAVRPVEVQAAGQVELAAAAKEPRGSVYLFLGLANVFSTGLDTLADELRARKVPAQALNYAGWGAVASDIEARYAKDKRALPVVIVGHSFGADAAIALAAELGRKKIPVSLVVIFDATRAVPVSANVRHLINYYSPSGVGKKLSPAPGFKGRFENINVDLMHKDIGHLTIEKQPAFHKRVISEVLGVYGGSVRSASSQ